MYMYKYINIHPCFCLMQFCVPSFMRVCVGVRIVFFLFCFAHCMQLVCSCKKVLNYRRICVICACLCVCLCVFVWEGVIQLIYPVATREQDLTKSGNIIKQTKILKRKTIRTIFNKLII